MRCTKAYMMMTFFFRKDRLWVSEQADLLAAFCPPTKTEYPSLTLHVPFHIYRTYDHTYIDPSNHLINNRYMRVVPDRSCRCSIHEPRPRPDRPALVPLFASNSTAPIAPIDRPKALTLASLHVASYSSVSRCQFW